MAATAIAVTKAQNRAIAKGTDPKAATCRAKLQRARSALNRQMDRELRLREGAENLLRATTKDGGGDGSSVGGSGGGRNRSKNRKLIRQTVALELSFLESNVRLLADELDELNGSVDVYQPRDDEDDDYGVGGYDNDDERFDGLGRHAVSVGGVNGMSGNRHRRRRRQMPMIAVPLKDTRPIDFGPPLERFISQHYGVDLSAAPVETDESDASDGGDGGNANAVRRRLLSLREAVDELTQLRKDTQTPSRDADGVRLLLRYYRQLYYVDRRFFPPSSTSTPVTTTPRNHHGQHHQQQDPHSRHSKQQSQQQLATVTDTSTPPPAIYFEWYDSFGGPVPSCGQRTVRFEQACVLFNVAAVYTQMGAKHDRRCSGGRDDDDTCSGVGKLTSSSSTSTGPEAMDGASAATQCFLRAAGAYRHIGDTFANAPARAADLRATGVLYAVMMAQAYECVFEKLQWRLLKCVRHRCRRICGDCSERGGRRKPLPVEPSAEGLAGDRRGRNARDAATRRLSATAVGGINDVTVHTPSWTELAREAAHVSRMYAEVVHTSCRPDERGTQTGKENGGEQTGTASVLPDVWVSVCRIKDRHYAALAYRYAACALLPYYRSSTDSASDRHRNRRIRDRSVRYAEDDSDADELFAELTTAAAAAGLESVDDDDDDDQTTPPTVRRQRRRARLGKLLLEAAAAAHDRAARTQRLCRQLRTKAEGNAPSGGGLLASALDRERLRTVRLLLLHRRNADDEYCTAEGNEEEDEGDRCCCRRRCCSDDDEDDNGCNGADAAKTTGNRDFHYCCSDDDGVEATAATDHGFGGGDQEEFTAAGIAGIPGLDVDRGVLIRPRTRLRLMAIAPDFTDTGDGDDDVGDTATTRRRGDDLKQQRDHSHESADREERRADLFAGLGPVAVFSARHRYTRPRWTKVAHGGRYHSAGDIAAHDDNGGESTVASAVDPIQLVDRWFGFELRSYGGGNAAAVPPATVGHVRSDSQAQYAGLRRGDIVVALKRPSDSGIQVLDVRWDTCRRVAELIVQQYHWRQSSCDSSFVQLKIVTPITDVYSMIAMDPNKMYSRRRTTGTVMNSSLYLAATPPPSLMPQSSSKQQRRQRRQTTNSVNEATESTNKIHSWLWNPFRRKRRSVTGNKC